MYARKVLIVEDHQESRESLATVLKKARFDVLEAGSLKTAFSMISDGQIAAIVTELKLSDGDGLSLLGQLKKNGLECPIVFVTAFGTMSSAIQAMKMGAANYLTKPVTAKDLTEAVSAGCEDGTNNMAEKPWKLPRKPCNLKTWSAESRAR